MAAYTGADLGVRLRNLTPRHLYRFRLWASNPQGRSQPSATVQFTTRAAAPAAPPAPRLTQTTTASLQFSFQPGPANSEEMEAEKLQFVFEISAGSRNNNDSSPQVMHEVYVGEDPNCLLEGLQPGYCYTGRLALRSSGGQSPWSALCRGTTLPLPPAPPAGVRLLGAPQSRGLSLQWNPPASDGGAAPTEYRVQIATANKGWLPVYVGPRLDCTVKDLQPHSTYTFRAAAQNRAGVRTI